MADWSTAFLVSDQSSIIVLSKKDVVGNRCLRSTHRSEWKGFAIDVSMKTKALSLLPFFCISAIILGMGGWLTYLGLSSWYYELRFPPFQPPSWVFSPVWTIVLTLLAIATWMVFQGSADKVALSNTAMLLYGMQCVLNIGWSLLFFTLQRPDIALWNLLVLDVVLFLMVVTYSCISRMAGRLVMPYFAWLVFATAINWWIVAHNGPFDTA